MSGEILGIAGISGSGQKELLEAIAGLQPVESGSICYIEDDGTRDELLGKDPLSIAEKGITLSFVPEDRLGMGLVGGMDLSNNMMLRSFRKGRSFFTDRKSPRNLAKQVVEELSVKTPSIETPVRKLSGGNVQKVLVGGTNHTLNSAIVDGRGFTAVMVSWLGKFNPLWMILTSLLLVFLGRGAGEIATDFGLNFSFGDILTGIILFFIIGGEFFINYKLSLTKSSKKEEK